MNHQQLSALMSLHKQVVLAEQAKEQRDQLLLDCHEAGNTQIELAQVLNRAAPDSVSRNAVQKIIQRKRKESAE